MKVPADLGGGAPEGDVAGQPAGAAAAAAGAGAAAGPPPAPPKPEWPGKSTAQSVDKYVQRMLVARVGQEPQDPHASPRFYKVHPVPLNHPTHTPHWLSPITPPLAYP